MSVNRIGRVLVEAIIVGIALIPFTYIAGFLAKLVTTKPNLPEICDEWNENYIMEVNLFLAGFLFHITFEVLGLNKWYCQNTTF
jgi:hypothetical protein